MPKRKGDVIFCLFMFLCGYLLHKFTNGYLITKHSEKVYEIPIGKVQNLVVTESFGLPFLEPETTILTFQGRTIYKAKRDFQEPYPYARNIQVGTNNIQWDDGEFKFNLLIEKLTSSAE